jgi:hypothetical protein
LKRITVLHYAGSDGSTLKVARRIARKMLGAQRLGICVLIDLEDVKNISADFLTILVSCAVTDKARFCGLSIREQHLSARCLPTSESATPTLWPQSESNCWNCRRRRNPKHENDD